MIRFVRDVVSFFSQPQILFPLSIVVFFSVLLLSYVDVARPAQVTTLRGRLGSVVYFLSTRLRKIWTNKGGLVMLIVLLAFLGLSSLNPDFRRNAYAPDNVPIVGLIFLVGFFTWFSIKQAFENDARMRQNTSLIEEEPMEKVMVWPDLVYTEFICTVILGVLLTVWSIGLKAPLEQPANPTFSPPVMKAPWYFLGLQEMLVYYDPWMAGVVLPSLIIIGLMAIPYIDRNPKGSGYYTFAERKYEVVVFLFGFIFLWVLLILIGTFLRGPNWNFFGPYDYWDVNKVVPMVNINLSEYMWVRLLGVGLPTNWFGVKILGILMRESFGILLLLAYYTIIPPLLAKKSRTFNRFYATLGPTRYYIMLFLLLTMFTLPLKMFLRWTINLKYIIAIPEYFFNF